MSSVLSNHLQVRLNSLHYDKALHKKAATTTQSKLAEYIKGANKGKGIKGVGGYGTAMKAMTGSMHGNQQ